MVIFSHESTLQRVLELVSDSRSSASKKRPRVKIFKGRQHVLRSGCIRQPTCIISRSGWIPEAGLQSEMSCELAGDPARLVTKA